MIPYIDMHCDTLACAYLGREESIYKLPKQMLDMERLKQGGALAQFFAVFMLPESMKKDLGEAFPEDMNYIKSLLEIFRKSMKEYPEIIRSASSLEEYETNKKNGRISGILSVEDGRAVEGKPENIRWLYEEGVRMMAILWNYENCFGYPNSKDAEIMQRRLTPFGKEAVGLMNDLGMIIDVSHLNDGGFWDVVQLTQKPFVASHSNCRAISPHQRNLTDEQIKALANKGGVMGLNFCGPFLNEDAAGRESRISQMLKHLKHMVNVGGSDIAAIGTDFDGTFGEFDIQECSQMQLLFETMEREHFSAELIEKIAYKNVERVLRDTLK